MKKILIVLIILCGLGFSQTRYYLPLPVVSANGRPLNDKDVDLYQSGSKVYDLTFLTNSAGAYYNSSATADGTYDIYVEGKSWRTGVYINTSQQNIGTINTFISDSAKVGTFVFAAENSSDLDSTLATYHSSSTSSSYTANHHWDTMMSAVKSALQANTIETAIITILPGDYYGDQEGSENAMFLIDTSNVTVFAYGARMYNANSANGYTVKVVNSSNVHWYGGEVYGNSANQSSLGVGYTFDNCSNWSIQNAYAFDTRSDNFRWRSSTHGLVANCIADSSSDGRGFLFDREGTTGSLLRGSRNILLTGSRARRQGQAALRFQQAYDITVDGGRYEAPLNDGGTRRTVTIANDDITGTAVDSLFNLSFNGVTFKYGAEIEIKGASGNITFKACDFYGTKFTIDKADFFLEPVGVHFVVDGCFFDFLDDADSRFINVGSTLPYPSRIEVTNNHFKGRGSLSRAISVEGNSDVVIEGNIFTDQPARAIYLGANVRRPFIRYNKLEGNGAGGGNSVGIDVYADSARIEYNSVELFKWGIAFHEDSSRIVRNYVRGISATGDSGIVQYDATPVDNWFIENELADFSVDISDAGGASGPPTTEHYWNNIGSIGATSRNKWTLGSRGTPGGGLLTITDTLSADIITTPTVVDTAFIGTAGVHWLTMNPGLDQLRIRSNNSIQFMTNGQTTDYLRVQLASGENVAQLDMVGDSYIVIGDHVDPPASDSTQSLGHNATHRWNRLGLWPVSTTHFDASKYDGKFGFIDHDNDGDGDSLWVYIDGSTRMNVTSGNTVTP